MSVRPVSQCRARSPPSKAPASSCSAPSGSATRPTSIRSCCSTTSATTTPTDYLAGFPWHPHRGIETITYVLAGDVEHGDSLGNRGTLGAGDVQWMTAGSGILHQEMPKGDPQGRMHGFQLWANLPSSLKMTRAALPGRRRRATSPTITDDDGTQRARRLRQSSGARRARWKASPPIRAISTSRCRPAGGSACRSRRSRHAFAYVFAGCGHVPRRVAAACRC